VGALDEFDHQLRRAQVGDEDAFAAIWRSCQAPLLRYLWVKAGSAAEDLAADTWLQVARTLDTFVGDERAFRSWLFTIARHRHIDWRRKSARRGEMLVDVEVFNARAGGVEPGPSLDERLGTEAALRLISSLPGDQAEVVMLRTVVGLDVATTAEIVGRPPGTVRVLAHRGLRKLAGMLEPLTVEPASTRPVASPARARVDDLVAKP
jgi:RNA polymerase sigma-70 factor, ECF subfamily